MHFWYQTIYWIYILLKRKDFYKKCLLIYVNYIYKSNSKSVSQLNFTFSIIQKKKCFFSFISLWNKLTFSTGDGSCREVKEDANLWRTAILFTVNNKNMVCHFSLANMSHIRLLNTDVWPMFCFLGLFVFGTTLRDSSY